jgi:hypothetical protein
MSSAAGRRINPPNRLKHPSDDRQVEKVEVGEVHMHPVVVDLIYPPKANWADAVVS